MVAAALVAVVAVIKEVPNDVADADGVGVPHHYHQPLLLPQQTNPQRQSLLLLLLLARALLLRPKTSLTLMPPWLAREVVVQLNQLVVASPTLRKSRSDLKSRDDERGKEVY